nr:hypothetical protein [Kofleriaceae bacterium]
MRAALVWLACGACANASPLAGAGEAATVNGSADGEAAAWREIATRARPIDASSELLERALDGDITQLNVKTQFLEQWTDAGGRLTTTPHVRPFDDNDRAMAIGMLGLQILEGSSGEHTNVGVGLAAVPDDRTFEAALYLAQRMRRDGDSMLYAMLAVAIERKVMQLHRQPPAFAATYAPTDAEVVRAFDAEAMWVARTAAWAQTDDASRVTDLGGTASYKDLLKLRDSDPLTEWSWLASAPSDRGGFEATLAARAAAAPQGDPARELPDYAKKLYETVDAYQQWLKSSP